jgi:hypothetical protein
MRTGRDGSRRWLSAVYNNIDRLDWICSCRFHSAMLVVGVGGRGGRLADIAATDVEMVCSSSRWLQQ